MNLANTISFSRILGVGLIYWLAPYTTNTLLDWVIVVYTLICLTDFFDGWVARRFNIVSDLGKVLDPLADKILVLVFLPLLEVGAITSFPVFLILAREFAIMALRVVSAKRGIIISANLSGKIKTAITLPVCGLLFARVQVSEFSQIPLILAPVDWVRRWVFGWPNWAFDLLIWAMVIVTIASFLDYLFKYVWHRNKKSKRQMLMLIPSAVTLSNLIFGLISIVSALSGHLHLAALFILMGIVCDAMDGSLARRFNVDSDLGEKLDTKADFVTFGFAPACIVYFTLSSFSVPVAVTLAVLYYASVHFRLKRFNKSGHSKTFEGLPSPIGASIVVMSGLSAYLSPWPIYLAIVTVTCLLMVSRIPYPHHSATRDSYLRFFRRPGTILLLSTIFYLAAYSAGQAWKYTLPSFYLYEILVGLSAFYITSPLFLRTKSVPSRHSGTLKV